MIVFFFTRPTTVHINGFTGFNRITDYRKYTETSSQALNYIKNIPRAWNELKSQNNRSINHFLFTIRINVCVFFRIYFMVNSVLQLTILSLHRFSHNNLRSEYYSDVRGNAQILDYVDHIWTYDKLIYIIRRACHTN